MASQKEVYFLTNEIADFLASGPTSEQMLRFRPSTRAKKRARRLLEKNNAGTITNTEEWELDQFAYVESLMRLVKANIHARRVRSQE